MASQNIEGVLAAVQTKLRNTLATNVATVNADSPDDYAIEAPASEDVVIGVRADPLRYPVIFLLPVQSAPDADLGTRVLWRHRIRVVSYITDVAEEALALKLIRMQRAVRECLLKDRIPSVSPSSTAGFALHHVSDEYGPSFQDKHPDSTDFYQLASTLFEVQQQQDLA